MATKSAGELYEELRRKKLEENRRKLEGLNLHHLSFSLLEAAAAGATPKPSPAKKKRKPAPEEGSVIEKRRSRRIANLPEQSHKEIIAEVVQPPRKMYQAIRASKHRDLSGRVYASDEAREYSINKAEEVEKEMGTDYPSFVRPMLQSHTTGGFWLGLPIGFCTKHLPKRDSTMILVDENGDEFKTNYLAYKRGLSAGWRGFSIDHGLVDGDALVFQLINQTTFKVYIIRGKDYYSS